MCVACLSSGYLGGGSVLHLKVDGDAAVAAQPALHVEDADLHVLLQSVHPARGEKTERKPTTART